MRPLSPTHPLLAIDAPHAYASPYLLALGLAARVTGASATSALAAAGVVNILLLVLALRRFLVRLLPEGEAAAPYALLCILFLWGRDPWPWSGFFHAGFIGFGASYPSTFATAAMFLCLSLLLDALDHRRPFIFVGIGVLVALCVVTHPPTALVLFVGLAALFLGRVESGFVATATILLAVVVAGVALALAWPYYPVLSLLVSQPAEFHKAAAVFYDNVPSQIWPVMIASPVLAWRLPRDRRDPLVLLVVFLAAIYAIGDITGKYGLGRVIAFIAVFIQIALGAAVATWESRLPAKRAWLAPAGVLLVILGFAVYNRSELRRIVRPEHQVWPEVKSILAPIRPGDVVLAPSKTSYMVPALTGGRVVAWRHPVYWVPDHADRRQAQMRFFGEAGDDERRAVITRYHVRWILLDRREVQLRPEEEQRLLTLGCVVAKRDSLVLLDPAPSTCPR